MPLEASSFPEDVQVAFFVLDLLSDRWEGSSGMYLGKDWSPINFILDLYEVDNKIHRGRRSHTQQTPVVHQ